jgi:hypothetical protein
MCRQKTKTGGGEYEYLLVSNNIGTIDVHPDSNIRTWSSALTKEIQLISTNKIGGTCTLKNASKSSINKHELVCT